MDPEQDEFEDPGIRIFVTQRGDSFVGILGGESDDSFLIFFPSRLLASGDKRIIEPYLNVPYFRAMKSSISYVVPGYGEFEYTYLTYLISNADSLFTGLESELGDLKESLTNRLATLAADPENEIKVKLVSREELEAGAGPKEDAEELASALPTRSRYRH